LRTVHRFDVPPDKVFHAVTGPTIRTSGGGDDVTFDIDLGATLSVCPLDDRIIPMSTAPYLDRVLDPVTEAFTPELARRIVELRADPELEAQIAALRHKANEGLLTPEEKAAYEEFVEAVDLISIFQSKARQFLSKCPA
jgi:hypothetical protein